MNKNTQIEIIKEQLKETGCISRNWCLRNYISRLGAIIYDLKQEGYEFNGKNVKTEYGKDYVYYKVDKQEQLKVHP